MAYSISAFRVTFLIWICITIHLVHSTTIRGPLSDMSIVSDFISYVKPYIRSLQLGPQTVYKRTIPASTSDIAIDKIIKQLQPYLQDKDVAEKLELEGDDETTIIEFTPKANKMILNSAKNEDNETESFQANVRKYKKMRNKIKLAMERESVSNKTKHIVTRTLDELIAMLVQKQCPESLFQNSDLKKLSTFRTHFLSDFIPHITYDSQNHCYISGVKLGDDECRALKESYKHCHIYGKKISEEECKKLIHFAKTDKPCHIGNKTLSSEICKKLAKNITDSINMASDGLKLFKNLLPANDTQMFNLFNSFTNTISNVLRYSHKVPDNYKVKCTRVNINREKMKNILRNKDVCRDFRVCSEELREFLTVFYKSLNDTAVRAIKNYAAMYERDIVTDESEEKNAVIATINHASNVLEVRVSNAFVKTTAEIDLDENKDREMNIAALREYVKQTIKLVKKTASKHIEADLSALRARLLLAIKDDLSHNLASDLRHFESDVIQQICSFFITCKGNLPKTSRSQYLSRKQFVRPRSKSNSIFVNLELALDDDLKETLIKNHKAMLAASRSNVVTTRSQNDTSYSTIAVTRTTTRVNDEAGPKKMMNMPLSINNSDSYENDKTV